jgi:hypothetical protein
VVLSSFSLVTAVGLVCGNSGYRMAGCGLQVAVFVLKIFGKW